jgi:hypothetical protein
VVHRRGDLAEGGDLFVEVAHDEGVDVHGGGGFPVGLERGEVFFDGRQVGRVGAVEAAAGALEPDRAGFAAGLDVAGFAAVAERHRHRPELVGRHGSGYGWGAGPVVDIAAHHLDGFPLALQGHRVVPLGGADVAMIHQLFEHLDRDAGISVALGVGEPERLGEDQRPVERQRCPVGSG